MNTDNFRFYLFFTFSAVLILGATKVTGLMYSLLISVGCLSLFIAFFFLIKMKMQSFVAMLQSIWDKLRG